MNDTVIRVENLSKRYRIGRARERHDTLRDELVAGLRAPLEKVKSLVDRSASNGDREQAEADAGIWALKDVSFEVKRSEVLGLIGRNGAGKSTLLKILSRITKPTEGRAAVRGRVGSLLEVGTGFHPELTGRENVYLNGAILGMSRTEMDRKFDEIVAFAEVSKFLDTPIKRYSSGMKVRLAFAVAAHLEPEILLVDEVLAVGDAAFQKKCLGKMGDVTKEGRTVLFVSHNMAAIQSLCNRSILLDGGRIQGDGKTDEVVGSYLGLVQGLADRKLSDRKNRKGEGQLQFVAIDLLDKEYKPVEHASSGKKLIIRLHYKANTSREFRNCRVSVAVYRHGQVLFLASTELVQNRELVLGGEGYIDCIIDELPFSKGEYYLNPFIETNKVIQDYVEAAARMSVIDGNFYGTGRNYPPGWEGRTVLVKHAWEW
jgi:lipopolysaccharide transport system ATP-binding protein